MYLYAGKQLYDCEHSVIITSGKVSDEAKAAASKLDVEILEDWLPKVLNRVNNTISFSKVWEKYILPVAREKIYTISGKENTIVKVTMEDIERISSNGKKSKIDIDIFRRCYHFIIENGSLTKEYINQIYPKRASAFIFVVLAKIPFFEIVNEPRLTLRLIKEKYNL
jgi:exopolyphosphatase/pppGpp-phosphohydrolase